LAHVASSRPRRQSTLRTAVAIEGVGIHSGEEVRLGLHPAAPDTGIVFRRSDLPAGVGMIRARFDRVVDTRLCTLLRNDDGAHVATVEHLLAALAASGIDNLLVELDGPEVPILDGSAAPWMALIEAAGRRVQEAPRRVIRVLRPVQVHAGEAWVTLLPAADTRYSVAIDFPHPAIGRQQIEFRLTRAGFRRHVAAARTFGFVSDIARLQAQGLARGGSLENAIVVGESGVLNVSGLRFADEFVRHKLLDLIGDLYLAGAPILGQVVAHRPGHALNNALLHALFAQADAWRMEAANAAAAVEPSPLSEPATPAARRALTSGATD
jgi:UDP-3-O-[3-hydroxymyristoyl] N-acetylglucosamine deacetylase